jgi:hypothetical protein
MPTKNKSRTNSFIQDRSKQSSSFSNFTQWVKSAILRKSKTDISINERSIKKLNSIRRAPSKRPLSSSTKRRRSRKLNRRSGPGGSGLRSDSNSNSNSSSNSNSNSNLNSNSDLYKNNKNENFIIINDDDVDNYSDNKNNVNYDNNDDDNNMIIPKVNSNILSDICEISTSDMSPCKDQNRSRSSSSDDDDDDEEDDDDDDDDDSRNDFFENTRIIKGSDEHFAYVRTLRKLRRDRQRPMNQAVLLNNILEKISIPSRLSDEIRKELTHFKTRVYELNRLKRNSICNINDINGKSLFNNSTSSLCPSSLMNKRLSAIIAEVQPVSPITMKYRPSYASSKVVTIFDEITNQLVVKELPVARRKRRLSDLSNILVRSASSSSTTSTNSSQSSLVTLTDDAEQLKYSTLTKEPVTYIPDHIIIRNNDDDDDDEGGYEDDVPLFVLKEQFKYSGRGYGLIKNNLPSLEGNCPPCVTLTV